MLHIYSKTSSAGETRGGTEKIEDLLIRVYGLNKIQSQAEVLKVTGIVFLIGLSFRTILKTAFISSARIYVVKTATYSPVRNLLECLIYICLAPFLTIVTITKHQKHIYPFSTRLDLLELYFKKASTTNELDRPASGRRFKYGYVGRVDTEKGFFIARDLIIRLSRRFPVVMDVLIWKDADKEELPAPTDTLTIVDGSREKPAPIFSEIDNVILPYKDLSSTIAFPLVLLEACLEGCTVFTTPQVRKLAVTEFPGLADRIKDISELETDPNSNE